MFRLIYPIVGAGCVVVAGLIMFQYPGSGTDIGHPGMLDMPDHVVGFSATPVDLHDALAVPETAPLPFIVVGQVAPVQDVSDMQEFGFSHTWPAVYARARFKGDQVILAFDDPINRYKITLNGNDGSSLTVTQPGEQAIRLTGLGPGHHHIRVDKTSESLSGSGDFLGFYVPSAGHRLEPPEPRPRQIEFIGNSDTVGYGNTAPSRDCGVDEVFLLTDTSEAFGPHVARHFDADHRIIAESGIGLIRNYDGQNPETTMTDLYAALMHDDISAAHSVSWKPQVVVLALGSNDFATELVAGEAWSDQRALYDDFVSEYVTFLEKLRQYYPQALLILVAMADYGPDYLQAHNEIFELLHSTGDEKIAMVSLPDMEKTGCHWHPSQQDHQMLADNLVRFIEKRMDAW